MTQIPIESCVSRIGNGYIYGFSPNFKNYMSVLSDREITLIGVFDSSGSMEESMQFNTTLTTSSDPLFLSRTSSVPSSSAPPRTIPINYNPHYLQQTSSLPQNCTFMVDDTPYSQQIDCDNDDTMNTTNVTSFATTYECDLGNNYKYTFPLHSAHSKLAVTTRAFARAIVHLIGVIKTLHVRCIFYSDKIRADFSVNNVNDSLDCFFQKLFSVIPCGGTDVTSTLALLSSMEYQPNVIICFATDGFDSGLLSTQMTLLRDIRKRCMILPAICIGEPGIDFDAHRLASYYDNSAPIVATKGINYFNAKTATELGDNVVL